mmetsp:Transcript_30866/g.98491  ORF Transcript_30866/g.98491 Transcript_30866/m.98491 type:complete len:245 (-) Transcript_30866:190-924(-)
MRFKLSQHHPLQHVGAVGEGPDIDELHAPRIRGIGGSLQVARAHQHGLKRAAGCAPGSCALVTLPAIHDAVANAQEGRCLHKQHDHQQENHHVHQLESFEKGILVHQVLQREELDSQAVSHTQALPEVHKQADEAKAGDLLAEPVQDLQLRRLPLADESVAHEMLETLKESGDDDHKADLRHEDAGVGNQGTQAGAPLMFSLLGVNLLVVNLRNLRFDFPDARPWPLCVVGAVHSQAFGGSNMK